MHSMLKRRMNVTRAIAVTFGLVFVSGCSSDMAMMDDGMAHVHIGHVMTGWKDTPDNMGLLPTAIAEAKVAAQHAGFAASKPDDLGWMKTHTIHVMNAVDPSVEPKGPGLGYGVVKAAGGAAAHIGFAAESNGASDNVKAHAVHVGASTNNVVTWANIIVRLGKLVQAAETAKQAAPLVKKIQLLADYMLGGRDRDGDGKVSWKPGEGGLDAANQHMGFMTKGEGLTS
jgi:hypothetical protein